MRVYAFVALMALPLITLAAPTAKADVYCCGEEGGRVDEFVKEQFHVIQSAVVFGCDGYHCETNVKLESDIYVDARCRNGWCRIESLPFRNAWVLERCLRRVYGGTQSYPRYHVAPAEYESDADDPEEDDRDLPVPGYGPRY